MAIICSDLKILYVQVPGTGCSVVAKLLRDQFGGEDVGRKHDDVCSLLSGGAVRREVVRDFLVIANVRNPFDRLVTYYERLRGDWIEHSVGVQSRALERKRREGKLSASEFETQAMGLARQQRRLARRAKLIRLAGFNPWVVSAVLRWRWKDRRAKAVDPDRSFCNLFPMLGGVDLVLQQESLESALNAALELQGVGTPIRLPRANVTPGKGCYKDYYRAYSRSLVERLYGDQLQGMGYCFDGPRPGGAMLDLRTRRPQAGIVSRKEKGESG